MESANENRPPMQEHNEIFISLSECLIRHNEKHTSSQVRTSIVASCSTLTAMHRPTTSSVLLEENIRRTIATRNKPTVVSRSPVPLRTSSSFQLRPTIVNSEHQSNTNETVDTSSARASPVSTNTSTEIRISDADESKKPQPNTKSSQRHSRTRRSKSARKDRETELNVDRTADTDASSLNSVSETYDYKSPFSKECDQAILLQAQLTFSNNPNDWNLREFYRDVKVQFEPDTNTKEVFEKCLKLARLQANTIKLEQRRRPNDSVNTRPVKSAAMDRTTTLTLNSSLSPKPGSEKDTQDISEPKRELRCMDCKRSGCVGNCTASQEYPQYKRLSPSSLSPNMRDQTPARLHSRLTRTAFHLRPRTSQQATREARWKSEQTKLNSVVLAPSFDNESQTKRSQTPFTNGFLPGKLIRSQHRETLAIIPAHRASS